MFQLSHSGGSPVFHLGIAGVKENTLADQTRSLHAFCARALGGRGIDSATLANHHEMGGMPLGGVPTTALARSSYAQHSWWLA